MPQVKVHKEVAARKDNFFLHFVMPAFAGFNYFIKHTHTHTHTHTHRSRRIQSKFPRA